MRFETDPTKLLSKRFPFEKDRVYDMRNSACPDFNAQVFFGIVNEMRTRAQLAPVSLSELQDKLGRKGIQIEADDTIGSIAGVPGGTNLILVSPTEIEKAQVPPLMVIIHETLHILSRNFGGPEVLNEAMTQLLTVRIMNEYLHRTGTVKNTVAHYDRINSFYENNMSLLRSICTLLSVDAGVDVATIENGFISAYFRGDVDMYLRDVTAHVAPVKREAMNMFIDAMQHDIFNDAFAEQLQKKITALSIPDSEKGLWRKVVEMVGNIRVRRHEKKMNSRKLPILGQK